MAEKRKNPQGGGKQDRNMGQGQARQDNQDIAPQGNLSDEGMESEIDETDVGTRQGEKFGKFPGRETGGTSGENEDID